MQLAKAGLYAAGFPCTPFSYLHFGSSLLRDANARQLFRCISNLAELQPADPWQSYDQQRIRVCVCWMCAYVFHVCCYCLLTKMGLLENVPGFARVIHPVLEYLHKKLNKQCLSEPHLC